MYLSISYPGGFRQILIVDIPMSLKEKVLVLLESKHPYDPTYVGSTEHLPRSISPISTMKDIWARSDEQLAHHYS